MDPSATERPASKQLPIQSFYTDRLYPTLLEKSFEDTLISENSRKRKTNFSNFFKDLTTRLSFTDKGFEFNKQIGSLGNFLANIQDPKNSQVVRRIWGDMIDKNEDLLKAASTVWALQDNPTADLVSLWFSKAKQKDYPEIQRKLRAFSELTNQIIAGPNSLTQKLSASFSKSIEEFNVDNSQLPHLTKTLLTELYKKLKPSNTQQNDQELIDFAKQEGILDETIALEKIFLVKNVLELAKTVRKSKPIDLSKDIASWEIFVQASDDFTENSFVFFLNQGLRTGLPFYNPSSHQLSNEIYAQRMSVKDLTSIVSLLKTEIWLGKYYQNPENNKVKVIKQIDQEGDENYVFILPEVFENFSEKPADVDLNEDSSENQPFSLAFFPYRPYPTYPLPTIGISFTKDPQVNNIGYIESEEIPVEQ